MDKSVTEFYLTSKKRPSAQCKECVKSRVREHYGANREQFAAYERRRSQSPERKIKMIEYAQRRRVRSNEKYRARNAVSNALRDGRLERQPCEACGKRAQAHHDDYSKPLAVRWFCFEHHRTIGHGQVVIAKDYVAMGATKK